MEQAVELGVCRRNACEQPPARAVEQLAPDTRTPANDGGAVHPVEGADGGDVESIDVLQAQEESIAVRQRRQGRAECLLVGPSIAQLEVIELRIGWARQL